MGQTAPAHIIQAYWLIRKQEAWSQMDSRRFLSDVAVACGNDYASAFKLLGVIVFVAEGGIEPLLSGGLVAPKTFYRWAEALRHAGWGDLLADVRLRQAVRCYVTERLAGLPGDEARGSIVEAVTRIAADEAEPATQAVSRQASDAVKGLAGGREAEPSALDGVAAGGSLQESPALAGSARGEGKPHG